jgi:hypothetical protein
MRTCYCDCAHVAVTAQQRSVCVVVSPEVTMNEPIGSFHHQDKIHTPLSEWIFMAVAFVAVLVGLPVLLAGLFEFVVPAIGRAWNY